MDDPWNAVAMATNPAFCPMSDAFFVCFMHPKWVISRLVVFVCSGANNFSDTWTILVAFADLLTTNMPV